MWEVLPSSPTNFQNSSSQVWNIIFMHWYFVSSLSKVVSIVIFRYGLLWWDWLNWADDMGIIKMLELLRNLSISTLLGTAKPPPQKFCIVSTESSYFISVYVYLSVCNERDMSWLDFGTGKLYNSFHHIKKTFCKKTRRTQHEG